LQIGVLHWQLVGQIAVYSVHMNEDELCVSAPEMITVVSQNSTSGWVPLICSQNRGMSALSSAYASI